MTDTHVEHFKMEVRKYETLESQIKEINKNIKPHQDKLKELKKQQKELQVNICGFMQTNEITECKLQEGALLFKESKSVVPLNKNSIKDNITKFFREKYNTDEFKKASVENKAEQLFDFVYENREYNEKTLLKRVN